jgi:Exostosin family
MIHSRRSSLEEEEKHVQRLASLEEQPVSNSAERKKNFLKKSHTIPGWLAVLVLSSGLLLLCTIALLGLEVARSRHFQQGNRELKRRKEKRIKDPGESPQSSAIVRPESIHGRYALSEEEIAEYHLGCTMQKCFNRTRCGSHFSDFLFYLYPRPSDYDPYALYEPAFPSYNKERARILWDTMYATFAASPYRTNNPERACIFIPYFDMTASATVTTPACFDRIEAALQNLPFWHQGENHVLFDRHEDDLQPFNTEKAILFRASLHSWYARPDFDAAWIFRPEYFPCLNATHADNSKSLRNIPLSERANLAFFRGIASHDVRGRLFTHYDASNKLFDTLQIQPTGNAVSFYPPEAARSLNMTGYVLPSDETFVLFQNIQPKPQGDYCSLFHTCRYGLNPRGKGLLTYRTLEILQAGSLHVYIGDNYLLPYYDMIDWRQFSILIPENYASRIDVFLKMFSDSELQAMQARATFIYENYFETFDKELPLIWATLRARIYQDPSLLRIGT